MKNVKADTSRFAENGLQHLFDGEINNKGKAVGFHQVQEGSAGKIIQGTKIPHPKAKTNPAYEGVYSAEVEVWGYKKKARSTIYPDDWSKENIVNKVNEAYDNKEKVDGNLYRGKTDGGIEMLMRIDSDGKILTAYIE